MKDKKNNQNFRSIPHALLRDKLQYLCQLNGINYVVLEESCTSKSSFWDKDPIPVYGVNDDQGVEFSRRRIHRGLYRMKDGSLLNADGNGALNILRKSEIIPLDDLYAKGEVKTPVRLTISHLNQWKSVLQV